MTTAGSQRRRALVSFVRQCGRLEVSDLADRLGVALETVRRDLTELERSGVIRRAHGSVYPIDHAGFESTLNSRSQQQVSERRRIAAAAYNVLGDAETVYLDEGSTCLSVAEHLVRIRRPVTVVTPSLPAAMVLAEHRRVNVIMLGGELRRKTLGIVGPWVSDMISSFTIDLAILAATGVSLHRGLTTPNPAVSEIKANVVVQAARKFFVGDHTKFGIESFTRFAHVSDFDAFITDRGLSLRDAQGYARLGPTVDRV